MVFFIISQVKDENNTIVKKILDEINKDTNKENIKSYKNKGKARVVKIDEGSVRDITDETIVKMPNERLKRIIPYTTIDERGKELYSSEYYFVKEVMYKKLKKTQVIQL